MNAIEHKTTAAELMDELRATHRRALHLNNPYEFQVAALEFMATTIALLDKLSEDHGR